MKYNFKIKPLFILSLLAATLIASPLFSSVIKLKPNQLHSVMGYTGKELNISLIIESTGMIEEKNKFILIPYSECMLLIIVDGDLITELRYNLNLNPNVDDITKSAFFLMCAEVNVTGQVKDFIDAVNNKENPKKKESKFTAIVVDSIKNFKVLSMQKSLPDDMVTRLVFVQYNKIEIFDSPHPEFQKKIKYAQIKCPLIVLDSNGVWFKVKEEFEYGGQKVVTGWIKKDNLSSYGTEFPQLYKPQLLKKNIYNLNP